MDHATPLLRWGLIFLRCPVPMSEQQRLDLMRLAAAAYFGDTPHVDFDWGALRGSLKATSEAVTLGSFYGQRFEAEIHRPEEGPARVEFLVTEKQLQMAGGVAEA